MNDKVKIISLAIIIFLLLKKTKKKLTEISNNLSKKAFIDLIKPAAQTVGLNIGVPYEFIIAQIVLETNWGKSELFRKYFNVGGIKAVTGQEFVEYPTYEYIKGKKVRINQKFAVYKTLIDGMKGYSKILTNRYFKKYTNKTNNPKAYATLLQSGTPKYATDINYVNKIHKLIDTININYL